MRKIIYSLLLVATIGCHVNVTPVMVATIAENAILTIQTTTMELNASGIITREQALPVMDAIKKANENMKIVSAALKVYNETKSNGSALLVALDNVSKDIDLIKSKLPVKVAAVTTIVQSFIDLTKWELELKGSVK